MCKWYLLLCILLLYFIVFNIIIIIYIYILTTTSTTTKFITYFRNSTSIISRIIYSVFFFSNIWSVSRKHATSVNQGDTILTMMNMLKCTQISLLKSYTIGSRGAFVAIANARYNL